MAKTIKIDQFRGMNNVKDAEGDLRDPTLILNADVTAEGRVARRDGYEQHIALSGAHSLHSGQNCLIVCAGNKVYELKTGEAVEIDDYDGPDDYPMSYANVNSKVYMSNLYWKGIYDPAAGTISSWGVALPDPPVATQTTGNLPAGTYHLCFTAINSDGQISGNGPITQIYLSSDDAGISLSNRGTNVVWMTDPNGDTFYRVGQVDAITILVSVEPLPSFLCSPPYFMDNITYAFGRMWGSRAKTVFYSEPFQPWLFRNDLNFFEFPYDVNMVAASVTGLFVGTAEATYSLLGTKPDEMRQSSVGAGTVPGTLTYCDNVRELGDVLSPEEKIHNSVPIWVTHDGIVLGNASGRLYNLTNQKVNLDAARHRGASLYRRHNGRFQVLSSFKQGELNDDVMTAVKATRLFEPPAVPSQGEGIGFGDSFEATVFRDGVPVS